MDNNKIQLIGAPCGYHGPYTFYKAFKYYRNGKHKILALSDFFFVKLWSDLDLMSIGEVQLLWMDKNSEQILASLRLYFLPENTPEGRNDDHGEDEVLAISEKVVLRVEDLLDRMIEDTSWSHGLAAIWDKECSSVAEADADAEEKVAHSLFESALDFEDVIKEKKLLDDLSEDNSSVVVLSFPRYCRYRGIIKRLEGVSDKWIKNTLVVSLGGFAVPSKDTRILFCKDTFDYPDLEGHELLCNHLAPNLKGRPRKKRKKRSVSPGGSDSNESESSLSTVCSVVKVKPITNRNSIRCNNLQLRRSNRVVPRFEEKSFLIKLYGFMESINMPIERIPHVGYKEIDLYSFYKKVQRLGGYHSVTTHRMWKVIHDEIGGNQMNTSAATLTRRHYERLLLQYELNARGVKTKAYATSHRQDSVQDWRSVPNTVPTTDNKKFLDTGDRKDKVTIYEGKISPLRSVRPKADKLGDSSSISLLPPDKENIPVYRILERGEDKKEKLGTGESSQEDKATPELIDLVDDSPPKVSKSSAPALKKRKLEILKEGGLEVTPITPAVTDTSVGRVAVSSERRPSVIQRVSPFESQVSITVTPDLGHILGATGDYESFPRATQSSGRQRGVPDSPKVWGSQRVTQSSSIYTHSESTVYGNPKDGLNPSQRFYHKPPPAKLTPEVEVLDLRTNSPQKPTAYRPHMNRVPSATVSRGSSRNHVGPSSKKPSTFPFIDGRTLLGSNLEITVVDIDKPPKQTQQQQHQRHSQQQRKTTFNRPTPRNETQPYRNNVGGGSHSASIQSNGRSTSRDVDRARSRAQVPSPNNNVMVPTSIFPTSTPPFPMALPLDPLYYHALYNSNMYPSPATGYLGSPPVFVPSEEHLRLYKDLLNQHAATSSRQGTGFLGLPRDGSTSITPVNRSATPTSK